MLQIIRLNNDFYRFDGIYWKSFRPDIFKKGNMIQVQDSSERIKLDKTPIIGFSGSLSVFDLTNRCFRPLDKTDYLFTPFSSKYVTATKDDGKAVVAFLQKFIKSGNDLNKFLSILMYIITPQEAKFKKVIFDSSSLTACRILHTMFHGYFSCNRIDNYGKLYRDEESKRYCLFNFTILNNMEFHEETLKYYKDTKDIEILAIDRDLDPSSEFILVKGTGVSAENTEEEKEMCLKTLMFFLKRIAKEH